MPPSVQRSNAKHYNRATLTEARSSPGYAHLLPSQEGWEEIADYALDWALAHARGGGRRPPGRSERCPGDGAVQPPRSTSAWTTPRRASSSAGSEASPRSSASRAGPGSG